MVTGDLSNFWGPFPSSFACLHLSHAVKLFDNSIESEDIEEEIKKNEIVCRLIKLTARLVCVILFLYIRLDPFVICFTPSEWRAVDRQLT